MRRVLIVIVVVLAAAAAGWVLWSRERRPEAADRLILYGNLDLRQTDVAFNNSERIIEVDAQEGDRVHRGQLLARLDAKRLEWQVAQAEAQVAAQKAVVARLHAGSRPEEIAQARANLQSARADAENARTKLARLKGLSASSIGRAVSQQDIDDAQAMLNVANAKVEVNQKALDLAIAGPRVEDIAQAEAQLRGSTAQLGFLRQELADTALYAPVDAVVRSRLMEPGEVASPQRPVFTLAIVDPKWVRAYVSEIDLGKVHPGMAASVSVDSFPGRRFEGWVGFISSVAEFTPKSVETPELRTKLVYEVRVFVKDPQDELRLGMPATVELRLEGAASTQADVRQGRGDEGATQVEGDEGLGTSRSRESGDKSPHSREEGGTAYERATTGPVGR